MNRRRLGAERFYSRQNAIQAVALVHRRGGVNCLVRRSLRIKMRILSIRANGLVRIEMIEVRDPFFKDHVGGSKRASLAHEMHGRMPLIDRRMRYKRIGDRRANEDIDRADGK